MSRLLLAAIMVFLVVVAVACAKSLPDPESEAAQLYVAYCSGSGCHNPIPPQGSSAMYWKNQYDRMLPIMADAGWKLPSPQETQIIKDYLVSNSRGARPNQ